MFKHCHKAFSFTDIHLMEKMYSTTRTYEQVIEYMHQL